MSKGNTSTKMSSNPTFADIMKSLQMLHDKIDELGETVQIIDCKVNSINHNQPTNNSVDHETTKKMTPGETHYRNNRVTLIKVLNDIIENRSTRKKRTLEVLRFTDDQPSFESISTPLDDTTLDRVALADRDLSLTYEAVCSQLEIQSNRAILSRTSTAAVTSLLSLCYQSEKKVQKELRKWIKATSSMDTSNSSENLPLFKFAENGVATATAKPDVTSLLLPMKLEIKDTMGNHGKLLIFFSAWLISV